MSRSEARGWKESSLYRHNNMRTLPTNSGFTILETLLSLVIFTLIYFVVVKFQVATIQGNQFAYQSLGSAQDARAILRVMVKELRTMKPGATGAYPIVQAATSTMTFYSDVDDNGTQDQVRYFISGTTLKKGVIKPTGSPATYNPASELVSFLAYDIKNGTSTSLFEYYDNSYTGTTSPLANPVSVSAIRLVRTNLLIDADPNRSPIPRLYTSQVELRNLKDNL